MTNDSDWKNKTNKPIDKKPKRNNNCTYCGIGIEGLFICDSKSCQEQYKAEFKKATEQVMRDYKPAIEALAKI